MKLMTLVNNYKWRIDSFDVYENKTNRFLYSTDDAKKIGLDIWVKAFSVYQKTTDIGNEETILEIWV